MVKYTDRLGRFRKAKRSFDRDHSEMNCQFAETEKSRNKLLSTVVLQRVRHSFVAEEQDALFSKG